MLDKGKPSNLSHNVMERIIEENRWTLPVHEQPVKPNKYFQAISSFILIIALLGISISFIFVGPLTDNDAPPVKNESITSMIEPTDYAKTFPHLEFLMVPGSTIVGTGEPGIYNPNKKVQNDTQLFWISAVLTLSMIVLFLSWMSRKSENPDYA